MQKHRTKILTVLDSAKQVGPAIFFSLVIIVVSFLPVFLLEAQEGRMFRPLAWTKTLAVGFSSFLAITLVPVLDGSVHSWTVDARIAESHFPNHPGNISAGSAALLAFPQNHVAA